MTTEEQEAINSLRLEHGLPPMSLASVTVCSPALALRLFKEAEAQLEQRWHQRIVARIDASMERDLRKDGPPQMPTTEQAALAMLKGLASHLEEAGQDLLRAAAALKDAGKGNQANAAYLAGKRAQRTAQELTGG